MREILSISRMQCSEFQCFLESAKEREREREREREGGREGGRERENE